MNEKYVQVLLALLNVLILFTTKCSCQDGHDICGLSALTTGKIYNGTDARHGQFPWMAKLQFFNGESNSVAHICGASLITTEWVLTAAHCLSKTLQYWDRIDITLGRTDLLDSSETGGQTRTSVLEVIHPNFRQTQLGRNLDSEAFDMDFALIKMDQPVDFTNTTRPICLPSENTLCDDPAKISQFETTIDNCSMTTVAGWGATENRLVPPKLKTTTLKIISRSECMDALKTQVVAGLQNLVNITQENVCAVSNSSGDTCKGDSGGPLMCRNMVTGKITVIGVVSYGGRCGTVGVYSRVCSILDWIKATIAGQTLTPTASIRSADSVAKSSNQLRNCSVPLVPNGYFVLVGAVNMLVTGDVDPGSVVSLRCSANYVRSAISSSRCGRNGEWLPALQGLRCLGTSTPIPATMLTGGKTTSSVTSGRTTVTIRKLTVQLTNGSCLVENIDHGEYIYKNQIITAGSAVSPREEISLECYRSYRKTKVEPDRPFVCLESGKWSPALSSVSCGYRYSDGIPSSPMVTEEQPTNRIADAPRNSTAVVRSSRRMAVCDASEFACLSENRCFSKADVCDGIVDCKDPSDEDCPSEAWCKDTTQFCRSAQKCILKELKCDSKRVPSACFDEFGCNDVIIF